MGVLLPDSARRPLVVTADEVLLDDLLRLLAAAGTEPEVPAGGPALRRAHREAPLVILGADVLGSGALLGLPRRPGVVVAARAELPAQGWAAAVELGAERVAVLPDDEGWLLARAGSAVRPPVPRGWLAVVGGGCGGAGASTLAVALAVAAADRGGVVLVDLDPWGGGLDLVVGAERADGPRWPELAGVRGRASGDALVAALPEVGGVRLLSASREAPGAPPEEAVAAVVEAVRGAGWPVVADLPRSEPSAATVLADADLAVLVTPARLRAACAARALLQPGREGRPSAWTAAHLVLRRVPGGLSVGEVTDVVGRAVLAEIGHDRTAAARAERGEPPAVSARSGWGAATRRLLAELDTAEEPSS